MAPPRTASFHTGVDGARGCARMGRVMFFRVLQSCLRDRKSVFSLMPDEETCQKMGEGTLL